MPKGKKAANAVTATSSSSGTTAAGAARSVRAAGAASGAGKTVSKASLKRAAHQSTQPRREPSKSCKVSSGNDAHTGLTPKLAALSSGDGSVPNVTFTLDSDEDDSRPASRTRAAAACKRGGRPVASKAFVHVGPGGSGKRYTGVSALKAAKKAWRDSKQLQSITVRAVDGGKEHTLEASAWVGPAGKDGLGANKFGNKPASSRTGTKGRRSASTCK